MINKITFTKQMLSAPLGETIYKIDWKLHKGMKQSGWRKYRVVCITTGRDCAANRKYKVEETYIETYFSLIPRWLSGKGFCYDRVFWKELDSTFHGSWVFDTHQDAVNKINGMISDVYDYEHREEEVVLEEYISWHPE